MFQFSLVEKCPYFHQNVTSAWLLSYYCIIFLLIRRSAWLLSYNHIIFLLIRRSARHQIAWFCLYLHHRIWAKKLTSLYLNLYRLEIIIITIIIVMDIINNIILIIVIITSNSKSCVQCLRRMRWQLTDIESSISSTNLVIIVTILIILTIVISWKRQNPIGPWWFTNENVPQIIPASAK